MKKALLIKNGQIITADKSVHADLLIKNGVISRIGEKIQHPDAEIIDAKGLYVMPGGIDAHTHVNLTVGGFKVTDGFFEGTAAAAFGGTTCIVEHPSLGPAGCSLGHQVDLYLEEASENCVVDFGIHGVFQHLSGSVLDDIASLVENGISSSKIYLTYDGRLIDAQILRVLERADEAGMLTTFHAEQHEIIEYLREKFIRENKLAPKYHPLSRPDYSEAEAIYRLISLAKAAGNIPIYIVHLSTAAGLEIIESARAVNQKVYTEVCPQYLLLDDSCYLEPDGAGLQYIMAPPLRKPLDTEALWRGLAEGSIDVVATDHCSFSFAEKLEQGKNDFTRSPGGIPGVETRLPLLFSEGVLKDRISLNRFVEVVSTEPARLMGLYPQKGTLAPGSDGDVVIFDPNLEKTISPGILRQNADYSPYAGKKVRGWPVTTIIRGQVVVKDGKLLAQRGDGKFIRRRSVVGEHVNQGD